MPRLLHTADWQIGRRYGRFRAEDAVPLAEARLETVERIAACATQRGADLVVVAGDVFDLQSPEDRTIRRLFAALAAHAGPWLLLPGNHDAALARSVWTRARALGCLPANVQVVETPGVVRFDALDLAVLAAPLVQKQTRTDLTAWFDHEPTPASLLRIGLAHGAVTGLLDESADAANPIAADRAATARLDYLALGDWHGTRAIDARTWYSGTPEPDRFRGNESGNLLQVDLLAPGVPPAIEIVPIGRYRWREHAAAFAMASDVDALAGFLAGLERRDVVALTLCGRVDFATQTKVRNLVDAALAHARAIDVDDHALALAPSPADIATVGAGGWLGDVLVSLADRNDEPDAREAFSILASLLADRVR